MKKNIGALFNCKCDPPIKRHKCYNFKSIFPHPLLKDKSWSLCSFNAEEHRQDLNSHHPNAKGPLEPKHSKGNLWGRENVQMENRTKPLWSELRMCPALLQNEGKEIQLDPTRGQCFPLDIKPCCHWSNPPCFLLWLLLTACRPLTWQCPSYFWALGMSSSSNTV